MYRMDFLFKSGNGYEELVDLIRSNPRFVFRVHREDTTDKRRRLARVRGWVVLRHRRYGAKGEVKVIKDHGRCFAEITDDTGSLQVVGSWVSWLASNASELVHGVDVRFE